MDKKKPLQLASSSIKPQRVCAVCGRATYSSGGIHPQCAQQQADARRVATFKAAKKAELVKKRHDNQLSPWQKHCPKCHARLHLRNRSCLCGHRFSQAVNP